MMGAPYDSVSSAETEVFMHCDKSLREVQLCKSCSWEMEGYAGPLESDLPDDRIHPLEIC